LETKSTARIVAGRYEIVKPLGNGKMSAVFLARDLRHKNDSVAVKILGNSNTFLSASQNQRACEKCGKLEHDPAARFCSYCGGSIVFTDPPGLDHDALRNEVFRRERDALSRLDHPNIVQIQEHGWCKDEGAPYIVLEYLDHTLLEEINTHTDPLDNAWCWPLMRLLTDALVQAHSANVIHCDIKPTNILMTKDSLPKLADFGISRLKHELTVGMTVSTFWSSGYASPEQQQGGPIDERSDIFALGAVFYHMLSRRNPPPTGPTPVLIDSLKSHNIPVLILSSIKKMVSPNADDRQQSATDILQRFERAELSLIPLPTIHLVITRKACVSLCDEGFISDPTTENALLWL